MNNNYPYNNANMEYPELYYRLNPKVNECIDRYMYNMPGYAMPTEEQRDEMIDDIYEEMIEECPEIGEDPAERRKRMSHSVSAQQRPYYYRGRLLRDAIGILLIGELLRRGRYGYPGYGYPGYGYPGYGYPGYGYPGYGY